MARDWSSDVCSSDLSLGQMMEPAEMPPFKELRKTIPEYAVSGSKGRKRRFLSSIALDPVEEEKTNLRLMQRWQTIQKNEVRYKEYFMDDAKFALIGFGSAGRVALTAVRAARGEGIKVGLIRPISLSPFPNQFLQDVSKRLEGILVVEMNGGMMLDDVRLAVKNQVPVEFYGRMGGMMPFPDEILGEIRRLTSQALSTEGDARQRWLARLEKIVQ
jgi:2-oxoglutarate ferredoxin oxidoreductase subunit alpha